MSLLPSTSAYNLIPEVHAIPLVFIISRHHTVAAVRGEKRVGQKHRTMGQIQFQGAVGCSHSWAVCRQPLQRPDNVWPRLALPLIVEIASEAITTNRRRKAELIML